MLSGHHQVGFFFWKVPFLPGHVSANLSFMVEWIKAHCTLHPIGKAKMTGKSSFVPNIRRDMKKHHCTLGLESGILRWVQAIKFYNYSDSLLRANMECIPPAALVEVYMDRELWASWIWLIIPAFSSGRSVLRQAAFRQMHPPNAGSVSPFRHFVRVGRWNCGNMRFLKLSEWLFGHFVRVGRSKLW